VVLVASSWAVAQTAVEDTTELAPPVNPSAILQSDRVFTLGVQATTIAPMAFRVGTDDQLQTVQGLGQGFYAALFADFAPVSRRQIGVTLNYGNSGDEAVQYLVAPTAYVQFQVLRQETNGVNLAVAVNAKKIGFQRPTDEHPNGGEMEGQILADTRFGHVL